MPGGPWAEHAELMHLCSEAGYTREPPRASTQEHLVQGLREHMQDWAVLTDLGKDREKGDLGWMLSQTGAICDWVS